MQRAYDTSDNSPVSEMAIVDTFTKLIFEEKDDYSDRELLIIGAFRAVDANVLRDTHPEMGEYLRNLGVREMISLVSRLREHMQEELEILVSDGLMRERSTEFRPGAGRGRVN